MINHKWEKAITEPIKIHLSRKMIKSYASAIQLAEPIYSEIEAARSIGFQDIPAPPTLQIIFWKYFEVPWLKDVGTIIHGKQRFQTIESLIANRTYDCTIELKKITIKQAKKRCMQVSEHELMIKYKGSIHAKALSTLIIFEN